MHRLLPADVFDAQVAVGIDRYPLPIGVERPQRQGLVQRRLGAQFVEQCRALCGQRLPLFFINGLAGFVDQSIHFRVVQAGLDVYKRQVSWIQRMLPSPRCIRYSKSIRPVLSTARATFRKMAGMSSIIIAAKRF